MSNKSPGSGEPYWYEWTVGLCKIVDMLDTDSDIEWVTLQAHGIKGWDDVIVRRTDRREWYQVKHSRVGNNLTFGSLVAPGDSGPSLLSALYSAWSEMKLDALDRCILFTNREASKALSQSKAGVQRPPLLDFASWLAKSVVSAQSLAEIKPPPELAEGWAEWLSQLTGTEEAILRFLRGLDVQTDQDGLDKLTEQVLRKLAVIFGVNQTKAVPLLHALDNALRDWSRDGKPVTRERVMDALALDGGTPVEHRAPPPPTPFFPSREPFIRDLERRLREPSGPRMLFLSAEPGSGKTSALSELANTRVDSALKGVVGLRYFAFRPITPEAPMIAPDAGRYVRADSLWFDLLRQFRRGLRGRLWAYQVPVRDELLEWAQAREHVLRLAAELGRELGRPFTIAIDGIDHAARAAIEDPVAAKEFFDSLPTPEEIADKPIRVLLAGQPAESYPQYPAWLRAPSAAIQVLTLPKLDEDDIALDLKTTVPQFPKEQRPAAVRLIHEVTGGNTLGVVFAVAETATCDNAETLRERLLNRELQSGVTSYYNNIWRHCLRDHPQAAELFLAGALTLARERITGALVASAFRDFGWTDLKWNLLLAELAPLLVQEPSGYRVRHNDLRVFLQRRVASFPAAQRRIVASGLADHYLKSLSSRQVAHGTLPFLLREAGREKEWPIFFTVDWVMEAAALGIDYKEIEPQCVEAIRTAASSRDWELMDEVACASETLQRWQERCEGSDALEKSRELAAPAFLRTEVFVRPFKEWDAADLRRLSQDAEELLRAEEIGRTQALLQRWLGGLDVTTIATEANELQDEWPQTGIDSESIGRTASAALEALGGVCRRAGVVLPPGNVQGGKAGQAAHAFEKGWVTASCEYYGETASSVRALLLGQRLHFLSTIIQVVHALADLRSWRLVKDLLIFHSTNREALIKFRPSFGAHAAWWALISGVTPEGSPWLDALGNNGNADFSGEGGLLAALSIARARGWQQPGIEPATIGDELVEELALNESRQEYAPVYGFWLRVAATIGRGRGVLARSNQLAASEVIRPQEIGRFLATLWERNLPAMLYSESSVAGNLATELVDLVGTLGAEHRAAMLAAADAPMQEWPIDYRRPSLWNLLRLGGQTQRLRRWTEKWLADDGLVWTDSADSRDYVVAQWAPFVSAIGADDLVAHARERLAWCRISYRSDRDDSFFASSLLLEELLKREPSNWSSAGHRLWSLMDGAAGVGAGINHDEQVDTAILKAALRSRPEALCRVVFAHEPNRRDEYWHHEARNSLIRATSELLREGEPIATDDKVTFWCLAVAFCRWFQKHDVALLAGLRRTLIDTARDGQERTTLSTAIEHLTPSEAVRHPTDGDKEDPIAKPPQQEKSLEETLDFIRAGGTCGLPECERVIRQIFQKPAEQAAELISLVLRSVAGQRQYPTSWRSDYRDSVAKALALGNLLTEAQLWPLLEAACSEAGSDSHWLQGVLDNIHVALVSRAAGAGVDALRAALYRHFAMHEKWIRGARRELPFREVTIPAEPPAATWDEAAARVMLFLLNSRSGEIVTSALHGIHVLALWRPRVVPLLLEATKDDLWRSRWILNAAEAWAALIPDGLAPARTRLDHWLSSESLEHRLQAWIAIMRLPRDTDDPEPTPDWPRHDSEGTLLARRGREILEAPVERRGLMRLSYRHRAASEHIRILEATLGDLPAVRYRATELLEELPPERRPEHSWPQSMRQYGDVDIGLHDIGLLVGKALDDTMEAPARGLLPRLAQAFLPNEDPWVLRSTPRPDPNLTGWPTETEIGDWRQPPDLPALREKLLLLTCENGISPGERVIAAMVEVYSTFHDVRFNVWWESAPLEGEVRSARQPTTISARSFCWWLADWWEPRFQHSERPIAFVPGGFQRLLHSFASWVPARVWTHELGWRPDPNNPLVWTKDGRSVARYETLHGTIRNTQNYHHRQPVLGRWVVTDKGWQDLGDAYGGLRRVDDIEHDDSPER